MGCAPLGGEAAGFVRRAFRWRDGHPGTLPKDGGDEAVAHKLAEAGFQGRNDSVVGTADEHYHHGFLLLLSARGAAGRCPDGRRGL